MRSRKKMINNLDAPIFENSWLGATDMCDGFANYVCMGHMSKRT
jgi:hypothetical protein